MNVSNETDEPLTNSVISGTALSSKLVMSISNSSLTPSVVPFSYRLTGNTTPIAVAESC
jgi:hypothetical protein